jgi:ABC-2 type transport system ATP-binding protein
MLKVRDVSKSYHRKKALSHCSFDLEPYQIMGIFGHNGCGKSTLFRIIMGILKADEGEIIVDHKTLGYMPEQRSLLIDLSLRKQANFMATLKGLPESELERRLLNLSSTFSLSEMIDKPLKTLSKGNQQKAQLILSILHEPKILILDEPFNGLDYHSQKDLSHWIRSYAQNGNAVLISSHQLDHMNGLCDEILILDHGITITQGHLKTIREQHQMYSVKVNADSNWKDLDQPYLSLNAIESLIELRFQTIQEAKKALNTFMKDKSVQSLHLEMVDLSELIHP